ncbi:gliding motility lipoprotein GldD [Flavobacteriales bacterium 34_180_T64]|nr:gliding motility lipoprotein GldD [Flavobacteriales bacterium 34_180_T64]
MKKLLLLLVSGLCFTCANDPIPKPKAHLRLEYPVANYKTIEIDLPFKFNKNNLADRIKNVKVDLNSETYGFNINYPTLKGTLYLTYKRVNETNLSSLLRDAQNITQKHVTKADAISEQVFIDKKRRVFGNFYEVGGNSASQAQFYVTDSINHFLNGSLYFFTKPNYDSIYPAAEYLKNDIKQIMESIEWKE